jgi:glycosyltransferase involved in cell wall biosynthesis
MTRTISVVMAAYKPVADYLKAAYESVASQELPAGWQWQWVVQDDGQTGEVAQCCPTTRGSVPAWDGAGASP